MAVGTFDHVRRAVDDGEVRKEGGREDPSYPTFRFCSLLLPSLPPSLPPPPLGVARMGLSPGPTPRRCSETDPPSLPPSLPPLGAARMGLFSGATPCATAEGQVRE